MPQNSGGTAEFDERDSKQITDLIDQLDRELAETQKDAFKQQCESLPAV